MQESLQSGGEIQENLLPSTFPKIPNMEFAAKFIPSSVVSGDIYNIFRLDEQHVGLYNIDVSGHGVPAALFSVSLHQRLNPNVHPQGLLKYSHDAPPYYKINPPEKVINILDEEDMLGKYGRYFTMIYAIANIKSGEVQFTRAGHNLPLIIHPDGTSEYINGGGPPIGLGLSALRRDRLHVSLRNDDIFIVFSDGINDSFSRDNEAFGFERIQKILEKNAQSPLDASFDLLLSKVQSFQRREGCTTDDISILGFKWLGSDR
jgi:sigma-B regulation protein RsbU (phosphoserine phosphatase)